MSAKGPTHRTRKRKDFVEEAPPVRLAWRTLLRRVIYEHSSESLCTAAATASLPQRQVVRCPHLSMKFSLV